MGLENVNNANVDSSAPIQPAQAYIERIGDFAADGGGTATSSLLFQNAGSNTSIIYIDASLIERWALAVPLITPGAPPVIDLRGNAIEVQGFIDDILLGLKDANVHNDIDGGTLQLEGGTNSTPSAAGLANKATLVGQGWTITNN